MKATELVRQRVMFAENLFGELVLWRRPKPLSGSNHICKYRLVYVISQESVICYDNEAGKGHHRHWGDKQTLYRFSSPEKLLADIQRDLARWNRENGDS